MNNLTSSDVIVFVGAGLLIILLLFGFIIFFIFSYRHKQHNYNLLQEQKQKIDAQKIVLENALTDLKEAQSLLIHSEKMASLGALTGGIAHEIQNPLNFVNNFSEVSKELLVEMLEELKNGDPEEAKAIADAVFINLDKINFHGKRADAIVKGMLEHSRINSGSKEPTDINALADEYLRLAYHGLRANLGSNQRHEDKTFNAEFRTDFDKSVGKINVIPQDIGRVLLNLYNNAFYAVNEKKSAIGKDLPGFENLAGLEAFEPTVSVTTKKVGSLIEIRISDNGNGIPKKIRDKIFQPFFTTKPTGQGTGLGLSLAYDIVKAHNGNISVESEEGNGATFIIKIPA